MSINESSIIESLAKGDLKQAKMYARFSLEGMKSNLVWRDRMLSLLSLEFMELPSNISEYLTAEDPPIIDIARTVLSADEMKIVNHVKRMREVSDKMAEKGIRYLNSTLLFGDSGTGKTTLAKYIAHVMDMPFISLNISTIVGSYLGSTSSRINSIFNFVQKTKCVMMLDELDVIGVTRSSGDSCSTERSSIVMSITQCIDRLPNSTILIAATNRKDIIDPALIRRFSLQKEVKLPDRSQVMEICKRFLLDSGLEYDENALSVFAEGMVRLRASKDLVSKKVTESMAISMGTGLPVKLEASESQTFLEF